MRDKKTCCLVKVESKHLFPHSDFWCQFDANVTEKVPAARKRNQVTKPKPLVKAKPAVTATNPKPTRQLQPVRSQPIVEKSTSLIPVSDSGKEGKPDKGKAVVGVKRRPIEDTPGPAVKRLRVNSRPPDLEVVDHLANLMDGTWDEVVKAREAVSAAEEHLRAVEGHLRLMDDWVRNLHRQA